MEDELVARRRLAVLLASSLLALTTAMVGFAGIASAHDEFASFTCNSNHVPVLRITLANFAASNTQNNTVFASIDGTTVLPTTDFQTSYSQYFYPTPATTSHTATVTVFAWDLSQFSKTWNFSLAACQTPPPPTPTPTPTSPGFAVSFTYAPAVPFAGQTVQFTDTSSGATSWLWTFGDSTSSSLRNPAHVYMKRGTYAVTLQVGNGLKVLQTSAIVKVNAPARPRLE
jgi:PKD repeat protein